MPRAGSHLCSPCHAVGQTETAPSKLDPHLWSITEAESHHNVEQTHHRYHGVGRHEPAVWRSLADQSRADAQDGCEGAFVRRRPPSSVVLRYCPSWSVVALACTEGRCLGCEAQPRKAGRGSCVALWHQSNGKQIRSRYERWRRRVPPRPMRPKRGTTSDGGQRWWRSGQAERLTAERCQPACSGTLINR